MRGKRVWLTTAVAGVLAAGFGLYWFQPWKLLTSKTVNDSAPSVALPANPSATAVAVGASAVPASPRVPEATLVAKGTLITHEHDTSGTVEIVRLPQGGHQLVFRDLSTSDGPDLRVWLTDQPVVEGRPGWHLFDDGRYVEIGRLKGTHGTLVYDLPANVVPADFTSVSIWCKRFSVSFGAARLTPA